MHSAAAASASGQSGAFAFRSRAGRVLAIPSHHTAIEARAAGSGSLGCQVSARKRCANRRSVRPSRWRSPARYRSKAARPRARRRSRCDSAASQARGGAPSRPAPRLQSRAWGQPWGRRASRTLTTFTRSEECRRPPNCHAARRRRTQRRARSTTMGRDCHDHVGQDSKMRPGGGVCRLAGQRRLACGSDCAWALLEHTRRGARMEPLEAALALR